MSLKIWRALLVEQFLRTWPFLAGTLILGILVRIAFADDWEYMTPVRNQLPIQIMIALGFASFALLYSAADSDKWTCTMPESFLRLPVPTFTLVLARFGYNLAAITALTLCFVGYEIVFVDEISNWMIYPITFACGFAILQLCAHAFGGLGDWSLGILTAVCAPFFVITDWRHWAGVSLPIAAVVIGASFLASWAIVHAQRQSRWNIALPGQTPVLQTWDAASSRPFRSKYTAQFWFEVVRIRFYFPIVLAGLVMAYIVYIRFFFYAGTTAVRPSVLELFEQAISQSPLFVACAIVSAGAFAAFQNYRLQFGPMAAFFYLRPISTADLGAMRVLGALACIASAFIGLELILLPTDYAQRGLLELVQLPVAAAVLWCGFWVVNGLTVFGGGVILVEIANTAYRDTGFHLDDASLSILGAAILAMVLVTAACHRLIVAKVFVPAVCLVLVTQATSLILFHIHYGISLNSWSDVGFLSGSIFYALLALAPFATVPLVLDWARHR